MSDSHLPGRIRLRYSSPSYFKRSSSFNRLKKPYSNAHGVAFLNCNFRFLWHDITVINDQPVSIMLVQVPLYKKRGIRQRAAALFVNDSLIDIISWSMSLE